MPEIRHEDRVALASQSPAAVSRLASSWRRSMVRHGLDPARASVRQSLSSRELAQRREKLGAFLTVAAPQIDHLFHLVCPTGCNVLLTDADGIVLEQRANDGDAASFRKWGLWQGSDWSEATEGTNGIGTCLAEGRPVTIHRDDHFFARNTGLSCIDAPIWGPEGQIMAALDVSSARADQTARWNALIAAQVARTAGAIEAGFFRSFYHDARIVIAQNETAPNSSMNESTLLFAVDRDDLVIGANRAARRAYGLEKEGALRPRPAADVLGLVGMGAGAGVDPLHAERAALIGALTRTEGNISAAARALGIGRATLYRRMTRLSITKNRGQLSHG